MLLRVHRGQHSAATLKGIRMTGPDDVTADQSAPKLDITVPHSARVWNYWLGGKDHFAADREMGDWIARENPAIVATVRADRGFLKRAVQLMVHDGIRQFLDVGTGLPTADNTHEVAQRLAPDARVMYVDNDPLVLVHARALLTSSPEGATHYIDADQRDTDTILREAADALDLTAPVAVTMLGVVHFVDDYDEALAMVRQYMNAVPSGSYLAIAHATDEVHGETTRTAINYWNRSAKPPITLRSAKQIAGFFAGLELLEPGVVSCSRWRPDAEAAEMPRVDQFCGVGRKP
jgi:hypothetical protein